MVEIQGDGSMLAFSSARCAVACAMAIQREISPVAMERAIRIVDQEEVAGGKLRIPCDKRGIPRG